MKRYNASDFHIFCFPSGFWGVKYQSVWINAALASRENAEKLVARIIKTRRLYPF